MPHRRLLLLFPLLACALFARAGQDPPAARDAQGDTLPAGAVARLGTTRFRHDNVIVFAAFLPGGRRLVSLGMDGTACVWEFPSGRPLRRFATHALKAASPFVDDDPFNGPISGVRANQPTRAAALSPDGTTLAAGFAVAATVRDKLPANGGKATSRIARHTEVRLYDVATGKERGGWKVDAPNVLELAFSPDGKHLTVLGGDGVAHLWDWSRGKEVGKVTAAGSSSTIAAGPGFVYSPDGKTLVLFRSSRVLQCVDVATGKTVGPPAGNAAPLTAVWFAPDGKRVLTQSGTALTGSAASLRARGLLAGNTTHQWDVATGKDLGAVRLPPEPGSPTLVSPDGRFGVTVARFASPTVARAATSRPAHLFDTATGKVLGEIGLEVEVTPVHRRPLVFSPDGKLLAASAGTDTEKIDLYAIPGGKRLRTLDAGPAAGPRRKSALSAGGETILFSPDGKTLAFQPGDAVSPIVLLDTATGDRVASLPLPQDRRGAVPLAFTPDGRCLLLNVGDGTRELVELASSQPRRTYGTKRPGKAKGTGFTTTQPASAALAAGHSAAVSPDGTLLALPGPNETVAVLDVQTGEKRADLKGHLGAVTAVAFAPDGKTLASASADTTVLIWDAARLRRPAAAKVPQPGDLDRWWEALAGGDATAAFTAIGDFAAASDTAVAFLKERVRPAVPIGEQQIRALIGRLDEAQYRVREKAASDLLQAGEQILPVINQVLNAKPTLETRKRLEHLRGQLIGRALHGERLRAYRAVEVLERIGTPAARQVLRDLAAGAPGAMLTAGAQAALGRPGEARP